jgi:hypothetical protein
MDLWKQRIGSALIGAGALIMLEGAIWFLFMRG